MFILKIKTLLLEVWSTDQDLLYHQEPGKIYSNSGPNSDLTNLHCNKIPR